MTHLVTIICMYCMCCIIIVGLAKGCMDGLRVHEDEDEESDDSNANLISLLGQTGRDQFNGSEQWIFPDLRFTCQGYLSKWIFRGEGLAHTNCRVQLTTWRLATLNPQNLIYGRVSTTESNIARVQVDDSIFMYELTTPVLILPDDIVGVELSSTCGPFDVYNNILYLNVNGSGSGSSTPSSLSFMRFENSPVFQLDSTSTYRRQGYHPIVEAVIGEL